MVGNPNLNEESDSPRGVRSLRVIQIVKPTPNPPYGQSTVSIKDRLSVFEAGLRPQDDLTEKELQLFRKYDRSIP